MALDAQRQGLDPLQREEGVEGRERRAEIAQQGRARLDDIGDGPERLDRLHPDRAVIARVRRIERRLALGELLPIEIAAVDDGAADRRAMAADIFGRRIDDDRRAMRRAACTAAARRCCRRSAERHIRGRSPPPPRSGRHDELRDWAASRRNRRACGHRSRGENSPDRSDRRSAPRGPDPSACWRRGSRCRHRDRWR